VILVERSERSNATIKLAAAYAAIYLIWGSTFLAIRFAIETVPPLLMMGTRALLAGSALYAFARLRGSERPSLAQWRCAAVAGSLLFLVGHGGLAWAEQRMTSGAAALISSTTPLWMILLVTLQERRRTLSWRVLLGLLLGVGGVALLAKPSDLWGGAAVDPTGLAVLLVADVSWAAGSVYSRNASFPRSPALTAGMNLLAGGTFLLLVSVATGDAGRLGSVSARSVASLLYLVTFGSIIAYAAYTWLLRVSSPTRVSSHSFVNPTVAVLAGAAIAGEELGVRTLAATLAMVGGAAAIVTEAATPGTDQSEVEVCAGCETIVSGPGSINPACECADPSNARATAEAATSSSPASVAAVS
jgi:drug/metabolite transporter (DMT)-like permease